MAKTAPGKSSRPDKNLNFGKSIDAGLDLSMTKTRTAKEKVKTADKPKPKKSETSMSLKQQLEQQNKITEEESRAETKTEFMPEPVTAAEAEPSAEPVAVYNPAAAKIVEKNSSTKRIQRSVYFKKDLLPFIDELVDEGYTFTSIVNWILQQMKDSGLDYQADPPIPGLKKKPTGKGETRTIYLTPELDEHLSSLKVESESFSDLINRLIKKYKETRDQKK